VKSRLQKISPYLAHSSFKDAVPTENGDDQIKIVYPAGTVFLDYNETEKNITNTFREVLGKPVRIQLVRDEAVVQPEETTESSDEEVKTTPMMRRQQAEEDEQIRPVLELFDARILETQ
jgi:hypothetical protein